LANDIQQRFKDAKVKLIEGSGGAFEVQKDGQLIFSKMREGRFPEYTEIFSMLTG
jgi:selT/selW/selH-like putative selenoprotein